MHLHIDYKLCLCNSDPHKCDVNMLEWLYLWTPVPTYMLECVCVCVWAGTLCRLMIVRVRCVQLSSPSLELRNAVLGGERGRCWRGRGAGGVQAREVVSDGVK